MGQLIREDPVDEPCRVPSQVLSDTFLYLLPQNSCQLAGQIVQLVNQLLTLSKGVHQGNGLIGWFHPLMGMHPAGKKGIFS